MDELRYRRILQAVCDTPWEIVESKLELIVEILTFRAEGGRLTEQEIAERLEAAGPSRQNQATYATISGAGGDIAFLTLYGVLMPRADLFSAMSGAKGLNQFQQSVQQALADTSIGAILIDVDSPGGQVGLVPETAALIRNARGNGKPIVAIANTMAASAAYHIASQADELVVSPSAMVGSIGCLAIHQDVSGLLDKAGIAMTLVAYGDHKTDLYPYEPLSQDGHDQLQESVTTFGQMFEKDVAAGRRVSVDTVHNTFGQGKMFDAQQAVKLGMADRVDTLDGTIARLAHAPSRARIGGGTTAAAASLSEQILERARVEEHAPTDLARGLRADTPPDDEPDDDCGDPDCPGCPQCEPETAEEAPSAAGLRELTGSLQAATAPFRARDLRALARELAPTDSSDPSATTPKGTQT